MTGRLPPNAAPRVAIVFPGLGSQHSGMGRKWLTSENAFRRTFEEGSDLCGIDLARLCLEPMEKAALARQLEGQLALFTYGVAAWRALAPHLPEAPSHFAGHSLGEVTALCAAGCIDFAAGVVLVKERAEIIARTSADLDGTMVWVLHRTRREVEAVCRSVREQGREVHVSAEDAPDQVAVSGRATDVDAAVETLERLGAMVFPLRLKGPFHSPMMAPAAGALRHLLQDVAFRPATGVVLSNASGGAHPGGDGSRDLLARQLMTPVRWAHNVEQLLTDGVGLAIEVGPRAVLGFLIKKNTRAIYTVALDAYDGPEALAAAYDAATVEPQAALLRCHRLLATTAATPQADRSVDLGRRIAAHDAARIDEAVADTARWLAERGLTEARVRLATAAILDGRILGCAR